MGDGLTVIEPEAFGSCSSLTNISFGANVRDIQAWAFFGCSARNVTLPSNLTNLGPAAFQYCLSLTNVTFPSGITSIGSFAFYECTGLTSIIFPASLKVIGDQAFHYCYGLTGVYFEGDAPAISLLPPYTSPWNVFYLATVYYLPGTMGWGATFADRPTALWSLPQPLIIGGPSFGVQSNQFGFRVSWATNVPVVVEACTDLGTPVWTPLTTNSLAPAGWFQFSDPDWTNYPNRLYRVRSQ